MQDGDRWIKMNDEKGVITKIGKRQTRYKDRLHCFPSLKPSRALAETYYQALHLLAIREMERGKGRKPPRFAGDKSSSAKFNEPRVEMDRRMDIDWIDR